MKPYGNPLFRTERRIDGSRYARMPEKKCSVRRQARKEIETERYLPAILVAEEKQIPQWSCAAKCGRHPRCLTVGLCVAR